MENRTIRISLKEEVFRKYKVYCAINDLSITQQTNKLIKEFVEQTEKQIKIINTNTIN